LVVEIYVVFKSKNLISNFKSLLARIIHGFSLWKVKIPTCLPAKAGRIGKRRSFYERNCLPNFGL